MKTKFLAIVAAVCICLGATACNRNSVPTVDENILLVNGYDSQYDLDSLVFMGYLGRGELNRDAAYIRDGEGSLKITVTPHPLYAGRGYVYQALDRSEQGGADMSDLAYVDCASFYLYNANEGTRRVGVKRVYAFNEKEGNTESSMTYFELQPGWNRIVYDTERVNIAAADDGSRRAIALEFFFDRGETDETYYLDRLILHRTSTRPQDVVKSEWANEICSFDAKWQVEQLVPAAWAGQSYKPELSFNTDPKFTSTGRGGSLHAFYPGDKEGGYLAFQFPQTYLDGFPFAQYGNKAKLCFDVYSPPEDGANRIYLVLATPNVEYYNMGHSVRAGEWTTIELSVEEIMNNRRNTTAGFADTTRIMITLYSSKEDRTLYFDNFRMEV